MDQTTKIIESLNRNIEIVPVAIDFSQVTDTALENLFLSLSTAVQRSATTIPISTSPFSTAAVIHNAGLVGDVSRLASQMTDTAAVDAYMRAHVTALIALNARFFQWARSEPALNPNPSAAVVPNVRRTLLCVNISTLLALQPSKSFSLYCCSRAARDHFIRVLAAEECSSPASGSGESTGGDTSAAAAAGSGGWRVRALSYAPGPLDTDMLREICDKAADPDVRASFNELAAKGQTVRLEDTARRLLQLIHDDRFADGVHIDYFDPLP